MTACWLDTAGILNSAFSSVKSVCMTVFSWLGNLCNLYFMKRQSFEDLIIILCSFYIMHSLIKLMDANKDKQSLKFW